MHLMDALQADIHKDFKRPINWVLFLKQTTDIRFKEDKCASCGTSSAVAHNLLAGFWGCASNQRTINTLLVCLRSGGARVRVEDRLVQTRLSGKFYVLPGCVLHVSLCTSLGCPLTADPADSVFILSVSPSLSVSVLLQLIAWIIYSE